MADFSAKWQEIGFVPFKEKDKIAQAYKDALQETFQGMSLRSGRRNRGAARGPKTEKERLIAKYNALEQDIVTFENNLGFFAMSKNAAPLIKQMEDRIAKAKEELSKIAEQIRHISNEETEK